MYGLSIHTTGLCPTGSVPDTGILYTSQALRTPVFWKRAERYICIVKDNPFNVPLALSCAFRPRDSDERLS